MSAPITELARRFTVDWLDRADPSVPAQIMTPDYLIHIGGVHLAGLEAYTAATMGQLDRFPGLLLTVHDLVTDGERLALVFTEHGASVRDDLRAAAWSGVALFHVRDGRLSENWTQEDYYARRRQLTDGRPDMIAAPAVAPWTTPAAPASDDALQAARSWLAAPDFGGIRIDDGVEPHAAIDPVEVEVAEIFSAADRVAFAATWRGPYRGTLAGRPDAGAPASLGVAGVVTVVDGRVAAGRIVTDRLGLRTSLSDEAWP